MEYQALEDAYQLYRRDPDKASDFFTACLAVAKQQSSVWAWGNDNHFDRESIAQDAVMAAFVALPTLKPHTIFPWWFLQVIRNKCRDAVEKKLQRNEYALTTDYSGHNDWESSYERISEVAGTNQALVSLLVQDYDIGAAAKSLGISTGAVKQRLQHIKTRAQKVA